MLQGPKSINPLDTLKASTPGASASGAEDVPSALKMEPAAASKGPNSSISPSDIMNDNKGSPGDACSSDATGGSTLPPKQTLVQGSTRTSESKPGLSKLSINTSALNASENSTANSTSKSSATGNSSGFDATSTNNRARLGLDSANAASPYSDAEYGQGADAAALGSENERFIPGALTPLSAVSRSHSPQPYPPPSPHPSEGGQSSDGRSPLHYPEFLPSPHAAAGGLSPAAYSPRAHSSDGQSPLRQSPLEQSPFGDDESEDSDSDDEFKNAVVGRVRGRRPAVKVPTLPNLYPYAQPQYTPANGPATDGPSGQSRNRFPVMSKRRDNVGDRFNRFATTGANGIMGLSIDPSGKRSRGASISSANAGQTAQGGERSVSRGTSPYRMPIGHRATISTSSQYNAGFNASNPGVDVTLGYAGAVGTTMPISIEHAASRPVSIANSYDANANEYKIEGHNHAAFLGLPTGNSLSPQIASSNLYSHSPHGSPVHSSPQYPPTTPEEILSQHSGGQGSPHHNSTFSSPGQLNGSSPPIPVFPVDQSGLALEFGGLPITGNGYVIPPSTSPGLENAFILQSQQAAFASGVPVVQAAYAQAIAGSPLTTEALVAQYGSSQERKDVDPSVRADSGIGEYPTQTEDFDLGVMFGQQSTWTTVNPAATIADPTVSQYLIGVGQNENIYANQPSVDSTQVHFDPQGGDHQEPYIAATVPPSPKAGTLPWNNTGEQNAGQLRSNSLTEWQKSLQAQQQVHQQQQQQMQAPNTLAVPLPPRPRPSRRRSKSDSGIDLLAGHHLQTAPMPTVADEPQSMVSSSYQPTSGLAAHGQSGLAWQYSNAAATAPQPGMMQDDITLGMHPHAQIRPFRSLHATLGHKKARSQNPIIKVEDFSNIPGRLNASHHLHNVDTSPFNPRPNQTGTGPAFAASAPPFQQAHSFPPGPEYSQHHGNAFSSEAHSNMGPPLHRPSLNSGHTYPPPNPTLPPQPVPQSSQAGHSNHQQYAPVPGAKQKQHGQRHEMDTKLLDGAFKPGSFQPDPPLRVLLELIRQQPFYMNETFEPSLDTVEAEHLLAVVRQYAPQDPRFAPRIGEIHSAYASSTGTIEPPKDSIYMLFTENNMCLLCGKQTDRSGRALGHVRSDLEHRPYHCDCVKCLSSPNPRKFFSDNLLDDHKKGQIVKQQCQFCQSSIRRGGMKRHMQSMHPGELISTDDMGHTENEMD